MSLPTRALGSTWTSTRHARRIIRHLVFILLVPCAAAPIAAAAAPLPERAAAARLELSRLTLARISLSSAPETATFTLDLDGEPVTVRLRRASLRSDDFRLLVESADGSLREFRPPAPATYRGTIDERPGAIVAGTIRDGRLTAALALADGRAYYVQPAGESGEEDRGLHVVYRGEDAVAGSETCTADGDPAIVEPREVLHPESDPPALRIADVAFDADFEYFQLNHASVDSTVHDIEAILAAVNTIYERDCAVSHRIATIIVRAAEPDPYDATAADALLAELKAQWNTALSGIQRDMVHLMTGRTLDGSTVGYANIGVVCNVTHAYGLSRSRYSSNFGKRATLTTHELGHNWNAHHCNRDPYTSSPCNIMCSTIAGCDGMGLPNFEPQGQAAVVDFAASRSCLDTQALAVDGAATASGLRLERPWPTPLRDHVSARFYLGQAGPVRLEVYDLSGRRVARLLSGTQDQGWHSVTWNGRDDLGRRVGPGVLFLRLESGAISRAQRLIIVR